MSTALELVMQAKSPFLKPVPKLQVPASTFSIHDSCIHRKNSRALVLKKAEIFTGESKKRPPFLEGAALLKLYPYRASPVVTYAPQRVPPYTRLGPQGSGKSVNLTPE